MHGRQNDDPFPSEDTPDQGKDPPPSPVEDHAEPSNPAAAGRTICPHWRRKASLAYDTMALRIVDHDAEGTLQVEREEIKGSIDGVHAGSSVINRKESIDRRGRWICPS